jgi:hypothetical protein
MELDDGSAPTLSGRITLAVWVGAVAPGLEERLRPAAN